MVRVKGRAKRSTESGVEADVKNVVLQITALDEHTNKERIAGLLGLMKREGSKPNAR